MNRVGAIDHHRWSIDDRTKDIWPLFGRLFHSVFACFDFEIISAGLNKNSEWLSFHAPTIEIFRTIDYSLERDWGEKRREARWRDRHGARQLVFYISSADLISVFWYTMDTAIGSRCSRVPDLAHPRQVWTNQNVFLFLTFRLVAPFGCLYPFSFFFLFYTTYPPLVFPACFITVKHFFYLFNIFLTRFSTSFLNFVPLVIPFFKFFFALLFKQFINPLINLFFSSNSSFNFYSLC